MKINSKISNFLVNNRLIIAIIMILITVLCGFLSFKVKISKDMTKYLSQNSEMKQGLDIMSSDFMDEKDKSVIRIIFDDLTNEDKTEIYYKLSKINYVESVTYNNESEQFNKDNHTLFIIKTSYEYGSAEELSIEKNLKNNFNEYKTAFQNNDIIKTEVPLWLLLTAFSIILIILIVMSKSWIEPFIFMFVTGIAVVINIGSNIIFGSISDITISIAPILQLILSLDYSIILTNRYREKLNNTNDNKDAMKNAIAESMNSIISSALTTIVGLVVLTLLSFKIGSEIGLVLAKGVFISMICVFTLLPIALLLFSKSIKKTSKRTFPIKTDWIGKFGFKMRNIIPVIFVLIFIFTGIFQSFTNITFTEGNTDKLSYVFPKDNMTILVYDNEDEGNIDSIIENINKDKNILSVMGYTNIFEKEYNSKEMEDLFSEMDIGINLDESIIKMIYYKYYNEEEKLLTIREFAETMKNIENEPLFSEYIDEQMKELIVLLKYYSNKTILNAEMSASELALFLQTEGTIVNQVLEIYSDKSGNRTLKMSPYNFITFLVENLDTPPFSEQFDDLYKEKVKGLKSFMNGVINDTVYLPNEMNTIFSSFSKEINENYIKLLYLYYSAQNYSNNEWTMSLDKIFDFLSNTLVNDESFSTLLSEDKLKMLEEANINFVNTVKKFKGERYSRLFITTDYLEESKETTEFMKMLDVLRGENLSKKSYVVGQSAMVHELESSFKSEYMLISIITAFAIFIVIALTFRSIIIPLILVLIVQCGVFITVSAIGAIGNSIYYLALLIVQSIIMGATIDYAIVLSGFYREGRAFLDRQQTLITSLKNSSNTILTSGSILITVTAILGVFTKNITSQVLITISIGSLTSVFLIMFLLPSILVFMDKFIIRHKKHD